MRAGPERSEEPRPGRRCATTSEALASLVIAKRKQSQPATGKVDPDDRTGVTHHLATRTGRRIDAHHARTHLTASFSRCVSRLGSGGRVEPKLQREWPSDPGQMVRHKNLMFPSSQVAPLTCARAVAPAVTTPSRYCSRHQQHPEPWWVSSVDLCTSFDVFGLLGRGSRAAQPPGAEPVLGRLRCACFLARRWTSAEKTASLWGPDSAKIARAS